MVIFILILILITCIFIFSTNFYSYKLGIKMGIKRKESELQSLQSLQKDYNSHVRNAFDDLYTSRNNIRFNLRIDENVQFLFDVIDKNNKKLTFSLILNLNTYIMSIGSDNKLLFDSSLEKNYISCVKLYSFLYKKFTNQIVDTIIIDNKIFSKNISSISEKEIKNNDITKIVDEYDGLTNNEILDIILDKISKDGYNKLSQKDKDYLIKYKSI